VSSDYEDLVARCIGAFSAVLTDAAIPTVAGIQIRIILTKTGFIYAPEAKVYYPSQTIPSGVPTTLRFGGAAEGGFAYTLLVPREAGIPIVALYFLQGKLGYVYAPLQSDRPIEVPSVDHDGLRAYVRQRFKIEVHGVQFG
jgi:hypothetical protein